LKRRIWWQLEAESNPRKKERKEQKRS